MSYGRFAYLYDELMQDAPYDQWVEFLENKVVKHAVKGDKLLDLACGTGELSVRLSKEGYDVTGIDLSDDMLAVAQEKAQQEKMSIQFFQQDMSELEGIGIYNIITIFCDSLNYLPSEEEILATFAGVHKHLDQDGLFLFDVHSDYKMNEIFDGQTFTQSDDNVSFIWNCFKGEHPLSIEHELSFFVLDESDGKYERFDEIHYQRTFEVEQFTQWLQAASFEILEIDYDFQNQQPGSAPERIFFTAKKK